LAAWLGTAGTLVLTFRMAAIASVVLGFLSFTLPDTPPVKKEKNNLRRHNGLDSIGLLKK